MAITGLRHTNNFVADQRPKNWREKILLLYPNSTAKNPLTALTALMKSEPTNDPEYNWWEKSFPSQRVPLSTSIDASQTTIAVTAGAAQYKAGHILLVEQTNELLYVAADPTGDTLLTVMRGFAATTPASVTVGGAGVNPHIRVVGSAYEEGSDAPTGINYDPTKKYNFTQIFRNTLEMTRTAQKTRLRTGDQVKEAKRECLELHTIEMEKAFIWGRRHETTFKGKPLRTTGGIVSFIPSGNVIPAGSTTDLETLEGWLERIFAFGASEKIAFTGNRALTVLGQIVRKNSQINITPGLKEYGMSVSRLFCPFGELVIFTHTLFNQLPGGVTGSTAYNGWNSNMLIVDQSNLKYRYIDDTKYEKKLENNDVDGMKSGYLTECGLEIHHPDTHFLITGITAAAIDG
jgi:hypothetical protein